MSIRNNDAPMRALAWMALSALGFSAMAIAVKMLHNEIPEFELVFFRSVINFMIVLALMSARGEKLAPEPGIFKLLAFRGVAGFCGVSCLFYSINHLPLPIAILLGWCSPIFVIIISSIFLNEKLPARAGLAISLAFGGLLLVLNPDFKQGWLTLSLTSVGIGLLGAAGSGSAYVAVRAATARVGANLVVLWFMAFASLLSAPLALIHFRYPTLHQSGLVLLLGVAATLGQVTMTQGYRFAPAGLVSTMSLLTAAFSAISGTLFFKEYLAPLQWAGMLALCTGIAILTWGSKRTR